MAQLPPKIPNLSPNWAVGALFPPNDNTSTSTSQQSNRCWVDEFLDFSTVNRRGTHRRSISDSIAFLDAPMLEECRGGAGSNNPPLAGTRTSSSNGHHHEFDKFDDEQLMSMFTDDLLNGAAVGAPTTVSSSNPSTPSDHNSINEDQKQDMEMIRIESEEVQSQCTQAATTPRTRNVDGATTTNTTSTDRIIDPKRVKRILANRQSAQRSRVRKLQYISELERSVTSLQAEVSVLSPRVAFLDHQRLLLNVDNSALKQRIAALAQDKIFKNAYQEALKREIERLREVLNQQKQKKMENNASTATATEPLTVDVEKKQLLSV